MNERLQELYREAIQSTNTDEHLDMPNKQVQRLILTKYAELVRQDEREACLAIVETHPTVRAMSLAIQARSYKC